MNEILQGDVLAILDTLSPESINCIVTSPPYLGLRDYQLPPTDWPEVTYTPMPGLPEITIPTMTCCLGLEDAIEAYVGHMVLVFRGLWRVLRGDGVAFLNLGDSYAGSWGNYGGQNRGNGKQREITNGSKVHQKSYNGLENWRPATADVLKPKNLCGIPWRTAFALQAEGWILRNDIIWNKTNPRPESVRDRCTVSHEYLFLLAKSERYYYDADAIREPLAEASWGRKERQEKLIARTGAGTLGKQIKNGVDGSHGYAGLAMGRNGKPGYNTDGRNKRTVWSHSTAQFPGAHFAVMPEALVELCLLAGCPAQVCVECGAPWVRVVEKEKGIPENAKGSTFNNGKTNQAQCALSKVGTKERTISTKTIAFTPTCQCFAPSRPGVALDPFFGSGTVGVVAKKFKRNWQGIELNPEYVELAWQRLDDTQPALFALT